MKKVFLGLVFVSLSATAQTLTSAKIAERVASMTPEEVWDGLTTFDASGLTRFGSCHIVSGGPNTACDYYFRGAVAGVEGSKGWPKNAYFPGGTSAEGSGCLHTPSLSPRNINSSWQIIGNDLTFSDGVPLSSAHLYTADAKMNAKNVLLSALRNTNSKWGDVCGISSLAATATTRRSISYQQTKDLSFIMPGAACTQSKVKCGSSTVSLPVNGKSVYTELPDGFCQAAYSLALKQRPKKDIAIISCADHEALLQGTEAVIQAAQVSTLSKKQAELVQETIPVMVEPYRSYVNLSPAQLNDLTSAQLSDIYLMAGKDFNRIRPELHAKILALPQQEVNQADQRLRGLNLRPQVEATPSFEESFNRISGASN